MSYDEPEVVTMLTLKTILGASWTVSSRLAGRLIDFVTVLVLARTLTPADFGLIALAMTLIAIVDTVTEIPLIQALTRLKSIEHSHLDTAFTIGVIRGFLLTLVVLAAAWPFSIAYHDGRLTALVSVLALGPMTRSLYSPGMVKYIRQMSFRPLFIAEFVGKIVASTGAISVVFLGGGYWAIATGSVVSSAATTLISYLLAPYRPNLTLKNFADFSTFLGWFSSAQIVAALSWQFDRILLGYFVSKSDLGQYAMASDLAVLPTQSIIGPAMQPVMAAFSRINDDPDRLRSAYTKASRFTMMLAVPVCIGMALTSDLIIKVLLGAKWTEAALYLRWLALATMLSAYYQPLYSLALAINRTKVVFGLTFTELCLRIALISFGLYYYSLIGAIAARGIISLIMFALTLLNARRLAGIRLKSEAANLAKTMSACAIMTLLVMIARYEIAGTINAFLELGIISILGAAAYIAALFAFGLRLKEVTNQVV
jgi:O-antigen/teichoic acid export membrane protein